MARILIVGGGCRGRRFAAEMVECGHAVRATTRTEAGRAAIEATGAECWIGTPDRLATLRGALDSVTVVCWLLATATGPPAQLQALHGSRLELFLTQAVDTTVRGFVYEASGPWGAAGSPGASGPSGGAGPPGGAGAVGVDEALAGGEQIVLTLTDRNAIPVAFLRCDPDDVNAWLARARAAAQALLEGPPQSLPVGRG